MGLALSYSFIRNLYRAELSTLDETVVRHSGAAGNWVSENGRRAKKNNFGLEVFM